MLCVLWKIDMFSSYFNTDLYNFTLWVGDFIFVTLRYVFPFKSASLEVFIAPGVEGIHTWVLEHWKRQISFKTSVSSCLAFPIFSLPLLSVNVTVFFHPSPPLSQYLSFCTASLNCLVPMAPNDFLEKISSFLLSKANF